MTRAKVGHQLNRSTVYRGEYSAAEQGMWARWR